MTIVLIVIGLAVAFVLLSFLIQVAQAAWTVFIGRLSALSAEAASIGGDALGAAFALPFEGALMAADRLTAEAAEWRTQRKLWRQHYRAEMPWRAFRKQMTSRQKPKRDDYVEALELLALAEPIKRADLDARCKRLLPTVHPDHGGYTVLTQLVNDARTVVLKRKGWRR